MRIYGQWHLFVFFHTSFFVVLYLVKHIHASTHARTHTCTHTHTHTHACTHIHPHIHAHTCMQFNSCTNPHNYWNSAYAVAYTKYNIPQFLTIKTNKKTHTHTLHQLLEITKCSTDLVNWKCGNRHENHLRQYNNYLLSTFNILCITNTIEMNVHISTSSHTYSLHMTTLK